MEIPRVLRHPIETFRIAPVGVGVIALSDTVGIACTHFLPECIDSPSPAIHTLAWITGGTLSATGTLLGAYFTNGQLMLRDRIESKIETQGFVEPYFERAAEHWCDRQTAKTIFRGTEHAAAFKALCKRTRSSNKLTWLPNF